MIIPAVAGARRVDVARRGAALLASKLAASARLAALLASEVARAQALARVAHLPSRTVGVDGALVGRSEVAARAAPALEAHACAIAIAPANSRTRHEVWNAMCAVCPIEHSCTFYEHVLPIFVFSLGVFSFWT
jgi:hypothetical protein